VAEAIGGKGKKEKTKRQRKRKRERERESVVHTYSRGRGRDLTMRSVVGALLLARMALRSFHDTPSGSSCCTPLPPAIV
jgi:hypothetical protein